MGRNLWLTVYLTPQPFNIVYFMTNPGMPEGVSSMSSMFMCGVYASVIVASMGFRSSSTKNIVLDIFSLVAFAFLGLAVYGCMAAHAPNGGDEPLPLVETAGLLDFSQVAEWSDNAVKSINLQKQVFLALLAANAALFILFTLTLTVIVVVVASKSANVSQAKHFLKWMIPNTLFFVGSLIVFVTLSAQ